jgi:hypothetical protein
MSEELGKLKTVDVRSQWPNEAADFTPWLANEENTGRLGAALGLELEVENTEVAVGPYSADILARDSGSGDYVVIENQLGRTDHDHLGKAITYAAVLGASAVVWIAPQFTEEHKKALDWLNDNSSEDVSFFGVRIELWKIDSSRPAVRFNVVSRPPDLFRKAAVSKAGGAITETKKLQLDWWTAVREALLEKNIVPSAHTPAPRYWYNVALGRTGIALSNIADTSGNKIGVRVILRHKYNGEAALAQLLESKEEIENEVGDQLLWDANPDSVNKIIAIYREANLSSREKWPEYLQWMTEMTGRFRKAFGPRVKQLDLEVEEVGEVEG